MGIKILQNYSKYFKILDTRTVMCKKFQTHDQLIFIRHRTKFRRHGCLTSRFVHFFLNGPYSEPDNIFVLRNKTSIKEMGS